LVYSTDRDFLLEYDVSWHNVTTYIFVSADHGHFHFSDPGQLKADLCLMTGPLGGPEECVQPYGLSTSSIGGAETGASCIGGAD
jgi:hypothetical protein